MYVVLLPVLLFGEPTIDAVEKRLHDSRRGCVPALLPSRMYQGGPETRPGAQRAAIRTRWVDKGWWC